jgi:predicted MFS family arabinose efflux permease
VIAALVALLVTRTDISHVFQLIAVIAVLAGASALVIRRDEIDRDRASGGVESRVPFRALLRDPRILVLIASTTLFQMAYQSAFPFVVLRVRSLGSPDSMVAVLVLVSQGSMVPVAWAAGRLLHGRRHKPVFALAFVILPAYLIGTALVRSTSAVVALQALGSVSAGIFGVAIVAVAADLTRGTGHFHALIGAANAAFAAGAVLGPAATGFLVERVGHDLAFLALALSAATGALLFVRGMPETRPAHRCEPGFPERPG